MIRPGQAGGLEPTQVASSYVLYSACSVQVRIHPANARPGPVPAAAASIWVAGLPAPAPTQAAQINIATAGCP